MDGSSRAVGRSEIWRLSTFSTLPDLQVSPIRLAESGFYYDGRHNMIICFSCGLSRRKWKKGEKIALMHLKLSPDCLHANFRDANNVSTRHYPQMHFEEYVYSYSTTGHSRSETERNPSHLVNPGALTHSAEVNNSVGDETNSGRSSKHSSTNGNPSPERTSPPFSSTSGCASESNNELEQPESGQSRQTSIPTYPRAAAASDQSGNNTTVSQNVAVEPSANRTERPQQSVRQETGHFSAGSLTLPQEAVIHIIAGDVHEPLLCAARIQVGSHGHLVSPVFVEEEDISNHYLLPANASPESFTSRPPTTIENNDSNHSSALSTPIVARESFPTQVITEETGHQCLHFSQDVLPSAAYAFRHVRFGLEVRHHSHMLRSPYFAHSVHPLQARNQMFDLNGAIVEEASVPPLSNQDGFDIGESDTNAEGAVSRRYATGTSRVRSFGDWPAQGTPNAQRLAEAGFYYTGMGDCVRCFYCGVTLQNWMADDDPWMVHVRFRFSCGYVIGLRRQDVVDFVLFSQ
ncbi:uncharacterized protein [Littorina saxatilis]|uniref:uncharacterized protein n=1 Tax=Littorina saxatilis TaxID=31220 RepID=UPI0038B4D416